MESVEGKRWSALRYQRKLRGWSQKELARRLSSITDQEDTLDEKIAGVTGDMIRKWENGYHLPSPFYRRRLCRLFNLSAVELGFVADLAEEEKKDFPEQSSGKLGSSSLSSTDSQGDQTSTQFPYIPPRQDFLALLSQAITEGIIGAARELGGSDMDQKRRQFFQQMLSLAGVSVLLPLDAFISDPVLKSLLRDIDVVEASKIAIYEKMLASAWDCCYTGSFQDAKGLITCALSMLQEASQLAPARQRTQLEMMRCRFLQLAGIVARDRMDFAQALQDGTAAVDLAYELDNAELIAAALEHRSGSYARRQQYDLALADIEQALPFADRSRPILRGNVYLVANEKRTIVKGYDKEMQKQILADFDKIERIITQEKLEDDGSYLKLNLAGLYIEQGKTLTRFELFKSPAERDLTMARRAFLSAHKFLAPDLVSWQANILIEEAEADLAARDIEQCYMHLSDALKYVQPLRSRSRHDRIYGYFLRCKEILPAHPLAELVEAQLQQA